MPVVYHLAFARIVYQSLPALILAPFLFLWSNRRLRAWVALVPFAVVSGTALVISQMLPSRAFSSGFPDPFPPIAALAGSLCILCLAAHRIIHWPLFQRLWAVPVLFLLPGLLTLLVSQANGRLPYWLFTMSYSAAAIALLGGIVVAAHQCRRRWTLPRFTLLLAAWIVPFVVAVIVMIVGFVIVTQPTGRPGWLEMAAATGAVALGGAAILYVIACPFVLTIFLSRFYRERLLSAFADEKKGTLTQAEGR